jgi:ubiquinol-cytochrome c reductase cytochrome c1 subunit
MFVRGLKYLIGLGFAFVLLLALFTGIAGYVKNPPVPLPQDEFHKDPKPLHLASDGPFGKFDNRQVQRGLQVYSEVCKACHSLKLVAFYDLKQIGYDDAEVKAFASQWQVPDINPDTGEASTRKGLPSDHFPSPFANDVAARAANNNALPPDLSDIVKAREGGAAYVYSILTGYQNQPAALLQKFPTAKTPPNLHYNPYFASLNIAMPQMLHGGEVTYADGTPNTADQEAKDVAAFLVWTSQPDLNRRHAAGIAVAVFLAFAAILGFLAYHQLWDEAKRSVRLTGPLDPENQAKRTRANRKAGVKG